ncbi:hypothetical protein HPB50_000838 [Hyalomma asiaticum]|uniref:Uncharacterized protein n=1 Tax=Hyalomma asiaticum TaxID=266040 RepID=A0ACB7RZI7_HYAAI|nr:hypothetical protein HPB50_000838 [Hyalomma asiaticum]
MLTPVWFILVAIAIPCQAYLDDRVLLDQHWTGFSPTCGGVRREDSKASTQDRRHTSARQRDNEPDKRSAGRDLGRTETGPLMVRDMRSITVLNGETSLHFGSDSARKPESTERSVRRVLSNLERVSKGERLDEASVRTSRTERGSPKKLASRKQERETGDRRLHCTDCEGSYRTDGERRKRTTADAPTWVKEDSRRRVRSTDRDLNSSANRVTSSRSSRSSGDGASVIRQNAESVERVESETRTDRRTSSLERVSRLTENRAHGPELDTRFGLSHRQDENNRVSRVAAGRQGSRRRANDRVNRNRSFRDDASYQSRLIVERLNDLHGIAKKNSFRSKSLSSRSLFTERHEMTERRRSTILPVQSSIERDRVGSPLRNERVANALRGLPEMHETMPSRTTWDARAQNRREGEDVIRSVHGIKRTERRTCEPLSSLHDNEVRRTGADKRSVDSASEKRRPDRFSAERTPPNVSDKRQRIHDGSFGPRGSRIDVRSMDDGERGNSYTMDQKFARSERRTSARSVSAVRRQMGVANGRFANTRETSIQVYRDRCQTRNGDVDARQVYFPARIAQRSARAIVLEQRIAAEGRDIASSTHFQSVERVEKRSEYRHDISDEQVRSVHSRERIAVDTRRTTDERRLAFARTQNARKFREFRDKFTYGESRRFENVYSRLKANKNDMSDTTRSTRNSREAGDSYRQSPDVRSSRARAERYILERRHNDKMDIERAAPNDRRDVTIVQERHKTEPHSSRRTFPSVHQTDYGVQKELDYHEKRQKSPMFWDELASRGLTVQTLCMSASYYRTNGSLLKTVLTVGVVAWMTMSPKKKLVD